ncbi:MAG: hypothetical protein JEZ07_06680 [Phycisphaerae bacterium]|nr:hypothetical protein [Phycisphaerae bacterium]
MYAVSSIAGAWSLLLAGNSSSIPVWLITITGMITMAIFAFIIKLLRVKLILWFILYALAAVAFFTWAIFSYPSIERALGKNGSWWAYIFSSLNMGLYASVLLSAIIILTIKLYLRMSQSSSGK